MDEIRRERDYYRNLSDELGAQVVRARDEQTRAERTARRSRTITSLIRRLYRLDRMNLERNDLAKVFLETALDSLTVDCAAVLQFDPVIRAFAVLHAVGFTTGGEDVLNGISVGDGFHYVNSSSPEDAFVAELRRVTGARYLLWNYDESTGFALLFANTVEDRHVHPPFQREDRELMESALDVFVNIVERQRAERQLIHDALHDPLTGLPNRMLFVEHLDQAMGRARRSVGYMFSVLFLDLDRFKLVNDSLGHSVGDELLVNFAERLRKAVRPGDVAARLGGDEFAVLVDDMAEPGEAVQVADRIQESLGTPFDVGGQHIFASVSIGIARSAERYSSGDELLRDADIAMYSAKEFGGGRHKMFDTDMHVVMISRLQLETDLRLALERGEMRLYYQPVVRLSDGSLLGFEALIRWKHPRRGLIEPMEFISLAEETGMIVPIGQWALKTVLNDLVDWNGSTPDGERLLVSLNISDREFLQTQLPHVIGDALESAGLPAEQLELELTERMLMHYARLQSDILNRLREMHVRIAIDDFGTGYSSLSRLQKLPIDKLKIDQSFIREMAENADAAEVVRTIIQLGHNLGTEVVAEGVESQVQLQQLIALGCEYAQGYLFSRPVDRKQADELIRRVNWLERTAG
ncbi:MAG: EAL domain-containing protein [Gammaproteobacteria bacterium]|jgi:diguanylate cyclase (GGDEF)-like protein